MENNKHLIKILSYKSPSNWVLNKCLDLLDKYAEETNTTEEINDFIDNVLHNSNGVIKVMISKIKSFAQDNVNNYESLSKRNPQRPRTFKYIPAANNEPRSQY